MRKVKILEKMLDIDDDDEADLEIFNITLDDEIEEVEIIPGWLINRKIFVNAGSASNMNKRLNTLMSALWSKDEMDKLVVKKRRKRDHGKREITTMEIKKLMYACIKLQSIKELPMEGVDSIVNIRAMISNKLKNDRYNNNRAKKKATKKARKNGAAASNHSGDEDDDDIQDDDADGDDSGGNNVDTDDNSDDDDLNIDDDDNNVDVYDYNSDNDN
ncbi:histone chaperone rtt106-like [Venturia canescens]|uniref:histone chaperone rtt106-like n=1 Tax=Venturia canescens TaxID=32260 RepID=UPI001C9C59A2|nr:histone chaperone rtt106-like [Venturia canescens]